MPYRLGPQTISFVYETKSLSIELRERSLGSMDTPWTRESKPPPFATGSQFCLEFSIKYEKNWTCINILRIILRGGCD